MSRQRRHQVWMLLFQLTSLSIGRRRSQRTERCFLDCAGFLSTLGSTLDRRMLRSSTFHSPHGLVMCVKRRRVTPGLSPRLGRASLTRHGLTDLPGQSKAGNSWQSPLRPGPASSASRR